MKKKVNYEIKNIWYWFLDEYRIIFLQKNITNIEFQI